MVHPECSCTSSTMYHMAMGDLQKTGYILSTEGMMKHARSSTNNEFVVPTETGILYRMKKENQDKNFIPLKNDAVCKYMKMITIEKVYNSLLNNVYKVQVPRKIADNARLAIERMLSIG